MTCLTPAIIEELAALQTLRQRIADRLEGRRVRVTSDHNGQPFGRSKKSWRGEIRRVKYIHIDLCADPAHTNIQLCLEGHEYGECFIGADEVEFVD